MTDRAINRPAEPEAAAWAAKARSGDGEALFRLMQAERERMYRIAFRYLGDEQDALDALQETAYRACRGIRKLREPGFARTWLIRILLNVCADMFAKRKPAQPLAEPNCPAAGPAADERIWLKDAVGRLPEPYRQVVVLKYFEDMTLGEVAQVLGRPEGTVKTWLHRALSMLRSALGREEGEHDRSGTTGGSGTTGETGRTSASGVTGTP